MKIQINNQQKMTKSVEKMFFELYTEVIELHEKMAKLEIKIIMANRNNKKHQNTPASDLSSDSDDSDSSDDSSDDSSNYYNDDSDDSDDSDSE